MAADVELPLYMGSPDESKKLSIIGRFSNGFDIGEFDLIPTKTAYVDPHYEQATDVMLGDGEATIDNVFPVFSAALAQHQANESAPAVARIDTDESYRDYVCDRCTAAIERKVDALRAAFDAHASNPEAHHPLPVSTVMGAVESISKLSNASTEDDALDAMEQVPVDAPPGVRAWKDGDLVVCSIRFSAADGTPRVATMADSIVGSLYASPRQHANKLVKKTARAALNAQRRADVVFGGQPVALVLGAGKNAAPIAALMQLKQHADRGHAQAAKEWRMLNAAANTPTGQKVAAPLIAEAQRRLEAAKPKGLLDKVADTVKGWLK